MGAHTERNADPLLDRRAIAEALTALGFKTKESTLASMATRGGGPPFLKYGQRVVYKWSDALSWAHSRLAGPINSTSEMRSNKF
jgi:hypothetical protein